MNNTSTFPNRANLQNRVMWLMTPGVIVVAFPLFGLIVWSFATGKDQFVHLRNLLESHGWLILAASVIAFVPTMYGLFLTIKEEARRTREADRTERIYAKFASAYQRQVSFSEKAVSLAMIVFALGFVCLLGYLHFFR